MSAPAQDIDPARLGYIQERVNAYLEKVRESPLYNLEDLDIVGDSARAALDAAVIEYAQGKITTAEVEAAAREFTKACKRRVPEKPARRVGNDEPPTYKQQKKNTYHWAQGRETGADREARKRMDERERQGREYCEKLWASSVEAHKANFPDCKSLYCPYCKE